ncbi:hypothetical protein BV898_08501 [Hypsibius exemplaris]|uniref:G-protein coupled receptors family 1 profile domain-containing protein n=1 Tax=Hypsibius exemplaris TaxID=2072580 RepID=A0A1W0WQH1_HYPEX|nr:hypothetical protein BV898_08501 [Hypsibius exemplaris]
MFNLTGSPNGYVNNSEIQPLTNRTEEQVGTTATAWFVFSITCCIIGTGLLMLLLLTSFHVKRLHSGSNVLVVHIMLIELIICGIGFPMTLITTYRSLTGFHVQINCNISELFFVTTINTEFWASLSLAINRFVALALPHSYQRIISKAVLTVMIFVPWVLGLSLNLPLYFGIGGRFFLQTVPFETCTTDLVPSGYGNAWVALAIFLPIGLIGLIYVVLGMGWIARKFWRRNALVAPIAPASRRGNIAVNARRALLVRMLVVTYLWHCLCFLPPPILLSSFPWLVVRYPTLVVLWLLKTVLLCGYIVSPVSLLSR